MQADELAKFSSPRFNDELSITFDPLKLKSDQSSPYRR
jgi:hypothetical protein